MNKTYFFILSLCTSLLILSCQKEVSTGGGTPVSLKLKSYIESYTSSGGSGNETFNVSYDGSNRISGLTAASNPGNKFTFSYPTSDKVVMNIITNGSVEITVNYYLKNGIVDSNFQTTTNLDTLSSKFLYTSGRLIQQKDYEYNFGPKLSNVLNFTYDANGNIIKSQGSNGEVETYTYYADKINTTPIIFPALPPITGKNLIQTYTLTSGGTVDASYTATYTFDSNNRLTVIKETYTDGTIVTKTFVYL
ncbi:MAG: hypothetical protein ABI784_10265 [Ginsengibacter sp.]